MTIERHTLAMILGLMSVLIWPTIPSYWIGVALLLLGGILFKTNTTAASFIIGISICILSINHQFNDLKYLLSANSSIKGTIVSLPQQGIVNNRFYFDLTQITIGTTVRNSHQRVLLTWTGQHKLEEGQVWEFIVKAKPITGLFNQGGFNYQRYLVSKSIIARGAIQSGTVIDITPNKRGLLSLRLEKLLETTSHKRFISALVIGDKRGFSTSDWQVMKNTGTSHLFAISGLHLSLIALFVAIALAPLLKTFRLNNHVRQCLLIICVLGTSTFYSYLAGFSSPTIRALTMVMIVSGFLVSKQRIKFSQLLLLTLLIIGIINPLSLLSQGLWLSLFAVAVVYLILTMSPNAVINELSLLAKVKYWFYQLLKLQLCLAIGLYFIQLIFFGGISAIAPVANLIAVPAVTLLILPMLFLAICGMYLQLPWVTNVLLKLSDTLLSILFYCLRYLANISGVWLHGHIAIIIGTIGLIFVSVFITKILTSISNQLIRGWCFLLFICIAVGLMWPTDNKRWQIDFLDVGHGNSAVIHKDNRAIIVDTGNVFGDDSTLAEIVIAPFLTSQQISTVDYIVITHQDKDHSAGLSFLTNKYPNAKVITNKNSECIDRSLLWRGLVIRTTMAKGLIKKRERTENNRSCLIRISNDYGSALFTGDIERAAEKKLLGQLDNTWQSQVMQIPHHGSKTSSSKEFVNLIKPHIGVVSARAFNQWNFPKPIVLKRYGNIHTQIINTANAGQITVEFTSQAPIISTYRGHRLPFWYNRDLSFGHYKR
jgi:competence protein ComEC